MTSSMKMILATGTKEWGGNELDELASVHGDEQEEQEVKEEDNSFSEDDTSLPDSARGDEPSIGSVETVDDDPDDEVDVINNDPPLQPEVPLAPRRANNPVPAAVRQLEGNLDGPH